MSVLVAYVSGHGFGHAVRSAEVLRVLHALAPELRLTVVSAAPERLFRRELGEAIAFRALACDVGLVQHGALTIDEPATAAAWRAWSANWDERVRHEARWLEQQQARVVLGDVPPLAFAAAHVAGVPALALANFSWDWIYRHYAGRQAVLGRAAEACATAYETAALLLRLPFACDLSVFRHFEDVGLVARQPRVPHADARRRLAWDERPTALVSFGGLGLPQFEPRALEALGEYRFVLSDTGLGSLPGNVCAVDETLLRRAGLEYVDLVGAADVVVSKPGYGIVSDCIAAGTRLVYTERGDFPEYDVLVAEMPRWLACERLASGGAQGASALDASTLGPALARVLARPVPAAPDVQGAWRAAHRLLEWAEAA